MSHSSPAPHRPRRNHGATPPSSPLLPPVSLIHCIVFCIFLAPQLLLQAGVFATFSSILQALPFLAFQMPLDVARRQLASWRRGRAEHQRPSLFEDIVLSCVCWAFINMDPRVGRVFFSRPVALPFFRFRQLMALGVSGLFRAVVSYGQSFMAYILPPFASPLIRPAEKPSAPTLHWREHHDVRQILRSTFLTAD